MYIYSVYDLLEYFLYCYEDYELKDLVEVKYDEKVIVEGKVYSVFLFMYYGKKCLCFMFWLLVNCYLIMVICFNCLYYKLKLEID